MNISNRTTGEVRLSGALTIRRATELHEALLSGLSAHHSILIQLDDEAEADISFVQLLLAAQVSARASGKEIGLKAPSAGPLREVLERGGFLAADETGFWTQGGLPQ